VRFIPIPDSIGPAFPTCAITTSRREFWLAYLAVLIDETAMMFVTMFHILREGGFGYTPLVRTVQRDGIIFYLYLQVLVVFNIIFIKSGALDTDLPAASIHRIIHAVLTSRMLLNMRRAALRKRGQGGTSTGTSVAALSVIEFNPVRANSLGIEAPS